MVLVRQTMLCTISIKISSSIEKESEKVWLLIRRLISGQIHMEH